MSHEKKSLDLRVVELFKASRSKCLIEKLNPKNTENENINGYVCLGHFDFMNISPLSRDEKKTLEYVEKDFKRRDNYNYPLYIIHDPSNDKEDKALDEFWKMRSCFMTVSRIHFTLTGKSKSQKQKSEESKKPKDGIKCIQSALKELQDDSPLCGNRPGDLSLQVQGEMVYGVFYQMLELSDLIVVLKSNSICSCLESIRRMMEVSIVGNVYSFYGVHGALCDFKIEDAIEKWNKQAEKGSKYFNHNATGAMEQPIPYASMRFSVIATQNAKLFWKQIKRPVYFISGTADAIINFSNAPIKDLVKYIAYLVTQTPSKDSNHRSIHLYDAFEDIITRIGIQYGDTYSSALSPGPKEPVPAILEYIQNNLKKGVKNLASSYEQTRWFPILSSQIDSLVTMIGNCITNNLSVLILPSVRALIDRLFYFKKGRYLIGQTQEAEIGEFLNYWNILENNLSRLEGELSQKPELLSFRYYVPATLLAFYMALIYEYNEFLLEINQEKEGKSYVPLITYNVGPRVYTQCILDPSTDKTDDPYNKTVPLLISLPVSMLYSPLETVVVLCHEMAHYTGTFTRYRENRFIRILSSCADLISIGWKLDGRLDYPLSEKGPEEIKDELTDRLKRLYLERSEDTQYYIANLNANLYQVIAQTFYDERLRSNLLQNYLDAETRSQSMFRYAKSLSDSEQSKYLSEVKKSVNNLLILYRECYADLVAVLALNLSAEEYLMAIFHREMQYIQEISPTKTTSQSWVLQIEAALVLYVLKKSFIEDDGNPSYSPEQLEWLKSWRIKIDEYKKVFTLEKGILSPFQENTIIMYPSEYLHLIYYLSNCKETLEAILQQKEVREKQERLIYIMNTVKDRFDLKAIQRIITDYQENLLNQMEKSI